jgi:hypothetical protein
VELVDLVPRAVYTMFKTKFAIRVMSIKKEKTKGTRERVNCKPPKISINVVGKIPVILYFTV